MMRHCAKLLRGTLRALFILVVIAGVRKMNVRPVQFAFTGLLIACMFNPMAVRAQYTAQQCGWVQQQLTQALNERSSKKLFQWNDNIWAIAKIICVWRIT
jgi:hypothetical protein